MRRATLRANHVTGATLVEAVIGIGVLAVAIPMVYGALAEAGKSGSSAEAETRGTLVIPACMEEIRASRDGRPQYFTATRTGGEFPPSGEVWALAFSEEGKPVGKLSKADYDRGIGEIDGKAIRYIASLEAKKDAADAGMLKTRISIEHPAATPVGKRGKIDFHTRIP
jgi:hypothetical protein